MFFTVAADAPLLHSSVFLYKMRHADLLPSVSHMTLVCMHDNTLEYSLIGCKGCLWGKVSPNFYNSNWDVDCWMSNQFVQAVGSS